MGNSTRVWAVRLVHAGGPSGWYTQTWGWYTQGGKKGPEGVYKSTMSKIPKVQKGIDASLLKIVKEVRKADVEGLEYLHEFWEQFKRDQPHLHKLIVQEI